MREVEKLAALELGHPGDGDEDTDEPGSEAGFESEESGWESARRWAGSSDGARVGPSLEGTYGWPDGGRDGCPRMPEDRSSRSTP